MKMKYPTKEERIKRLKELEQDIQYYRKEQSTLQTKIDWKQQEQIILNKLTFWEENKC